ncbi:MAG: hypothetical protein NTX25_21900, partial [Proteobacteria bacterium]|nr:hypothetical protein [Pseudomonadota bacterium]
MDYSRDRMVLNVAKWEVLSPTEIFTPKTRTHRPVRAALPIDAEAIAGTYGRADILPIEFFKWHAEAMKGFLPGPLARSFLSSGTTRSEQSQSSFTQEGLELYRKFSIQAFKSVLSHFFAHVPNTQGFSLIPPVHEWPTSSLAQMVEWISEEMPVHSLSTTEGFQPSEPIWLFATAFHLVNLADQGFQIQLPPGSIVIETGGTKGRSRTVSREELYTLIQKTLGVQRNRVVSEYGMCELASQAYDFVDFPDGPELNLSDRWYRLPVWADAYIFDRLSQLESSGEGALLIYDNLRTDFPWPIRSEDMVSLREDGAFQLLGRVPFAPLKGCSMLAEQVLEQTKFIERPLPSVNFPQNHLPKPGITARAEILHRQVQSIVDDPLWYDYWLSEFNSIQVVEWLRQDLRHTLPKDIHAWCLAAQQAIDPSSPRRWLIVPPSSHSFAWLQPLLIGAVAGLEL